MILIKRVMGQLFGTPIVKYLISNKLIVVFIYVTALIGYAPCWFIMFGSE